MNLSFLITQCYFLSRKKEIILFSFSYFFFFFLVSFFSLFLFFFSCVRICLLITSQTSYQLLLLIHPNVYLWHSHSFRFCTFNKEHEIVNDGILCIHFLLFSLFSNKKAFHTHLNKCSIEFKGKDKLTWNVLGKPVIKWL